MRLLLIEDDAMIGETVRDLLVAEGLEVDWRQDGEAAEVALTGPAFQMVLLDLTLPRKDGLVLLQEMRERGDQTPVIVTTARDASAQVVAGLNAGADDYVVKPYGVEEVMARIRAVLRRNAAPATQDSHYRYGPVSIQRASRLATVEGRVVVLTSKEWALLDLLMEQPGQALGRQAIAAGLSENVHGTASHSIESFVHDLRRKLGSDLIETLRDGGGYRIRRSEPRLA
jgi:DNA-binding response OmpR family regulator